MARLHRKSEEKTSLWTRIKQIALTDVGVLVRGLDQGSLEQLEELLLASDFGVAATLRLVDRVEGLSRTGKIRTEEEFHEALEREVRQILEGGNHEAGLRFA